MSYIIYKVCCDDCDDFYIGSTKAFRERKAQHKRSCYNENDKQHNLKIYQKIRENGGWDNWRMVIMEELGDVSKNEARIREEYYRMELKASLNMVKAYITEEEKHIYNKQRHKVYREENKDKIKERDKKYREENKDKIKERDKKYREENKDKIKERNKKYREAKQALKSLEL